MNKQGMVGVRASVGDSAWYSVEDSVRGSVGNSIWYHVGEKVLDAARRKVGK